MYTETIHACVFFSGVLIRTDPFIVGMLATLTCTSDISADRIEWLDQSDLDSERRAVARVTSMDRLDLTFNPVNDSIHNSVYTCRVTRGDKMFEENITITVSGIACDEIFIQTGLSVIISL